MDFYEIVQRNTKNGVDIFPDFKVCKSKDLMIRGRAFYAVWDERKRIWSTNEYDIQKIVDDHLYTYAQRIGTDRGVNIKTMGGFSSGSWINFKNYVSKISDNYHELDDHLIFLDDEVSRDDYSSKRLNYNMKRGECPAYEKLMSTLYDPPEREKLEWAIGSIIAGDSKDIQKFIVLYGDSGAGKSTFLNIVEKLFDGYFRMFEAKALVSSSNSFSMSPFRSNPLVAIQHDGDLSRIEDNTKLNSIVSHETMVINEKFKPDYEMRMNAFLFMGTNKPVKITDAKSGIIRRLIDVTPSGRKLPPEEYFELKDRIPFELGEIANHCYEVYKERGANYYNNYVPFNMIFQTDVFFNFVEDSFDVFKEQEYVALRQAYAMYKEYCNNTFVEYKLPMYRFREELKNYFEEFYDITRIDGKQVRSVYRVFDESKFMQGTKVYKKDSELIFEEGDSILDEALADCKAQYSSSNGKPTTKWDEVETRLCNINTKQEHYVKPPIEHIVIDFDIKDETGEKSLELNMKAAAKWPKTYAELSKSGKGIHLHYIYDGDVSKLAPVYDKDIEIKTFLGGGSLRRKLTLCTKEAIAVISSGLPMKEGKDQMINFKSVQSEKGLRRMIERNLHKEIHPATKPSIDLIDKAINDAYDAGISFDIRDMRPRILAFAANSTNQADYCLKKVANMRFYSDDKPDEVIDIREEEKVDDDRLVFFDVEVFPNLFLVNWKFDGDGDTCLRMINPEPEEIEKLFKFRLVGFNNRRYDNHILYARYLGYTNEQLYELSQRIVNAKGNSRDNNCYFKEAYNLSYTDVYDFSNAQNKISLKKAEIRMGIHHQELGLPWDQPVPEEKWEEVAKYCDNDVIATEKWFHYIEEDWLARQILAELSGLSVNHTTNQHTTRLIFGDEKNPQGSFVYTDLSEMFPGYVFENGKSTYRGEIVGEGGYVYAEPGIYRNVALLDIASMHPTSIEELNLFGPFTKNFSELKQIRILVKHGEFEKAATMLDGKLAKFLNDKSKSKKLANALKIAINSVYGLTSAKFDNPFKDPRNIDNIVAKRGALFMINLKHEVQERGYTVAHIKTDSIKIPNANPEIVQFVTEYGKQYGYSFEHEATYEKMCLVNDAVYIAKYVGGEWSATGAQFAQPYVFKKLFSQESILFDDLCEIKNVTTSLWLDVNEDLPEDEHNYIFVGKIGNFVPIKPGCGGGELVCLRNGKYNFATGAKGYRWLEAEVVKGTDKENDIDFSYHESLCEKAKAAIEEYGDFDIFVNETVTVSQEQIPWVAPCGDEKYNTCKDCPMYHEDRFHIECKLGYDVWPF